MNAVCAGEDTETLVTMDQVKEARKRLDRSGMVVRTPLLQNVQAMFPEAGNIRLHLKMENMQTTGRRGCLLFVVCWLLNVPATG